MIQEAMTAQQEASMAPRHSIQTLAFSQLTETSERKKSDHQSL